MRIELKTIILSVRPPWARQLVTGEKTVELRKRQLPGKNGSPVRAIIYETKAKGGRGMLIGEVVFEGNYTKWRSLPLHEFPPQGLRMVLKAARVTEQQAMEYTNEDRYNYTSKLWAWCTGDNKPIEYAEPKPLEGRPPQSWRAARGTE